MQNRYKKLFACAKELGLSIEDLRTGAASYTGERSLRALSQRQLRQYESNLEGMVKRQNETRKDELRKKFAENGVMTVGQREYLIDMISSIFRCDIEKFRAWLSNSFGVAHERFICKSLAPKVLKAASSMRARGYKAKA